MPRDPHAGCRNLQAPCLVIDGLDLFRLKIWTLECWGGLDDTALYRLCNLVPVSVMLT